MYAIVYWEDRTFSVVGLKTILSPRKELDQYVVGDIVTAKFQGKTYGATICEINADRGALNKSLKYGYKGDHSRILSTDETSNSQRARHSSEPAAPTSAPVGKAKRRHNSDEPRQKKVKETTHLDELAFAILNKRRNQAAAAQVPQQAVVDVTPPTALQAPPPDLGQVRHPAVVEAAPPAALHTHPPALVQDPQRAEVEVTPPAAMQTPPPAKAQVHQPALVQVPSLATFKLHSVPDIQVSPAVDVQAPPLYATPLLDCYGPPPPSAFRMSFTEMLESDHDMHEVCYTSPDGAYSSQRQGPCHGCCQIVHQLKTRLAEVEAELKRGRLQQPLITPRPVLQPRVQESTMSHGPNLQSLQDQISNEIIHETRLAKAITKAMTFVFRPEQLVRCSMKGGSTTPKGEIREGLPIAERCAIVDVISKKFALPISTVEDKMRWALRRLRVMFAENI